MGLRGALGDEQLVADIGNGAAAQNQRRHFHFAWGQAIGLGCCAQLGLVAGRRGAIFADLAVAESGDPAAAMGLLPSASDYLLRKAEEWGADLRYETQLVQLAQDEDGKATGAYAKTRDGHVLLNASKGVILATGVDEDFGKPAKDLLPLSQPPYFGAFFGGHVLCPLDGLRIDEHMRVLNAERSPIEGLYAVGNCSGSMYAGTYPELFIGNANGRTITHARHAVMHIAGEVG